MLVWIVRLGEPNPGISTRRMRAGMMAQALQAAGHDVVWWTGTFDHFSKKQVAMPGETRSLGSRVQVRFLPAPTYTRNLSLQRYRSHQATARAFPEAAEGMAKPDVLVVSMPDYHLGSEAVAWANRNGIPVVVDVRDPWPDVLWQALPRPLRPLGRMALANDGRKVGRMLRSATAITSVTESFHRWALRKAGRKAGSQDRVFYLASERSVVPEGAPIRSDVRALLDRLHGSYVVLFAGSLGIYNDAGILIEAARELAQEGGAQRIQIVVAGTGPSEQPLRAQASGLPNVHFTGWLERNDLAAVSAVSQIGVVSMPAHHDSVPNKVFAYVEAGLPLLVSSGGELAELVKRERIGTVFTSGDSHDLARQIGVLAENPSGTFDRRLAAKKFFEEACDASKVYSDYVALLESIVRQRGSR